EHQLDGQLRVDRLEPASADTPLLLDDGPGAFRGYREPAVAQLVEQRRLARAGSAGHDDEPLVHALVVRGDAHGWVMPSTSSASSSCASVSAPRSTYPFSRTISRIVRRSAS